MNQLDVVEKVSLETPSAKNCSLSGHQANKRRRSNSPPRQPPPTVSRHDISYTLRRLIPSGTNPEQHTWSLDRSVAGSCNAVGHNGLIIGVWWPHPICALRDGAHGVAGETIPGTVGMKAGTGGSRSRGAYSILASGEFASQLIPSI